MMKRAKATRWKRVALSKSGDLFRQTLLSRAQLELVFFDLTDLTPTLGVHILNEYGTYGQPIHTTLVLIMTSRATMNVYS